MKSIYIIEKFDCGANYDDESFTEMIGYVQTAEEAETFIEILKTKFPPAPNFLGISYPMFNWRELMHIEDKLFEYEKLKNLTVHLCSWGGSGDILIYCSDTWTEPFWGTEAEKNTGVANVYRADNDMLYTFEKTMITCNDCKNKL